MKNKMKNVRTGNIESTKYKKSQFIDLILENRLFSEKFLLIVSN